MEENKEYQFQVNMKGMIELLSEHIYSSPTVFVRELLQNAVDAITVRKAKDSSFVGRIDVEFFEDKIIFSDNGIGLTSEDMHQFLSVIGQSSKRGDLLNKGLIGKFGIGLLSCLVVSEHIVVESRSFSGADAVRWVGKSDGTYLVETIPNLPEIGTKVILEAKPKWKTLFKKKQIEKNILFYGAALPVELYLIEDGNSEQLLNANPIWLNESSTKEDLLEFGKQSFKTKFLDAFRLNSKAGELKGVAYILPNKVNTTATREHKIFLKQMYLCDQASNLLPYWSSFVRCIINTNALDPTASRESLMDNRLLQQTKKELSNCFKDYLKQLSESDLPKLKEIIDIHHVFIKALAVSDAEIRELFMDYLPFETNRGQMLFHTIRTEFKHSFFTPSLDDFRQIRRIAGSQDKLVINAAYSYEEDLIEKIRRNNANLSIKKIVPQDILAEFDDPVAVDERTEAFLESAASVLAKFYCRVELKCFEPKDTPAIYVVDEQALSNKNLQNLSTASNPFAATMQYFSRKEDMPVLCLNQQNKLILKLRFLEDPNLFGAFLHLLYVQALMLGGYKIEKREMDVFNAALYQLLSLGGTDVFPLMTMNMTKN